MTLEQRIENWARWVRAHPFAYVLKQCESFEGNYRSPQRNHWERSPGWVRLPPPNPHDAWDVTLAAATLDRKHHLVLRLFHVERVGGHRMSDREVARQMRRRLKTQFKPSDVMATEAMAKVLLAEALKAPVKERRKTTVARARHLISIAA